MIKTSCDFCGKEIEKNIGCFNRARKLNRGVYCNRTCSGLGRRKNRTKEELREMDKKRTARYKAKNIEVIRKRNREYWRKNYNPQKAKEARIRNKHSEYCRTPEYRKYKQEYDRKYRANKNYGEFADAWLTLLEIEKEIDNREAKAQNSIINKTQRRKRAWQNSQPKI